MLFWIPDVPEPSFMSSPWITIINLNLFRRRRSIVRMSIRPAPCTNDSTVWTRSYATSACKTPANGRAWGWFELYRRFGNTRCWLWVDKHNSISHWDLRVQWTSWQAPSCTWVCLLCVWWLPTKRKETIFNWDFQQTLPQTFKTNPSGQMTKHVQKCFPWGSR